MPHFHIVYIAVLIVMMIPLTAGTPLQPLDEACHMLYII